MEFIELALKLNQICKHKLMKKEAVVKFYLNFRLYIFPGIVALSSLFLILFAIYPQTVKLINNQKTAGELISKSKFLETKVSALESFNEEDLSRKVGYVLVSLPADKEFGSLLDLLQQKIAGSGFSIASISLGNTSAKVGNADSYEVKLELRGSRILLSTLLSNLESSSRLIRINSIDISSNQASQAIDVSLGIGVLYSGLPKNFGTADSPLPDLSQKDEELIAALVRSGGMGSSPLVIQSSPRGKSNPFE